MSGDERGPQDVATDEESAMVTDINAFSESSASETVICHAEEESPARDIGGAEEESPACDIGGAEEESPARDIGGAEEESPARDIGGAEEESPARDIGAKEESRTANVSGTVEESPVREIGDAEEESRADDVVGVKRESRADDAGGIVRESHADDGGIVMESHADDGGIVMESQADDGGGVERESRADDGGGVERESRADDVGGIERESRADDVGGIERESRADDVAGIERELLLGAIGGVEVSDFSGTEPNSRVFLRIEEIQQAFLHNVRNQLTQFKGIKDDLVGTIKEMKQLARKNPGNWEIFERLREHINEAQTFLDEIKEAIAVQESREEYMNLQIHQFFERRRQQGENFVNTSFSLGTIDGVEVSIQTSGGPLGASEGDDSSAEKDTDRSELALSFVNQMMEAGRMKRKMEETDESKEAGESKEVQESVDMEEAGEVSEEPANMEAAAAEGENVAEDLEDDGRLPYPPITGKYTLAIKAHQLYPESSSSSDDSPEQEVAQYPQGAARNASRQIQPRNIYGAEDVPVEDPTQDDSSSDSPTEESGHQL